MNYSPNNQQGLLSLVEALKSGLDPSVGYQLLGGIQQDQASQLAQRQDRLSGLADLLMGAAQQGTTYEGAQALAEAAPGPAGPAVQDMLSSLYGDNQPMTQTQYGPPEPAGTAPMPQTTSPVFQPPPPSPTDLAAAQSLQQGQMDMQMQQTLAQGSQDLTSDAAKYARAGKTMAEFIPVAMQAYPEFFQTPEGTQLFQSIVQTAFAGQGPTAGG